MALSVTAPKNMSACDTCGAEASLMCADCGSMPLCFACGHTRHRYGNMRGHALTFIAPAENTGATKGTTEDPKEERMRCQACENQQCSVFCPECMMVFCIACSQSFHKVGSGAFARHLSSLRDADAQGQAHARKHAYVTLPHTEHRGSSSRRSSALAYQAEAEAREDGRRSRRPSSVRQQAAQQQQWLREQEEQRLILLEKEEQQSNKESQASTSASAEHVSSESDLQAANPGLDTTDFTNSMSEDAEEPSASFPSSNDVPDSPFEQDQGGYEQPRREKLRAGSFHIPVRAHNPVVKQPYKARAHSQLYSGPLASSSHTIGQLPSQLATRPPPHPSYKAGVLTAPARLQVSDVIDMAEQDVVARGYRAGGSPIAGGPNPGLDMSVAVSPSRARGSYSGNTSPISAGGHLSRKTSSASGSLRIGHRRGTSMGSHTSQSSGDMVFPQLEEDRPGHRGSVRIGTVRREDERDREREREADKVDAASPSAQPSATGSPPAQGQHMEKAVFKLTSYGLGISDKELMQIAAETKQSYHIALDWNKATIHVWLKTTDGDKSAAMTHTRSFASVKQIVRDSLDPRHISIYFTDSRPVARLLCQTNGEGEKISGLLEQVAAKAQLMGSIAASSSAGGTLGAKAKTMKDDILLACALEKNSRMAFNARHWVPRWIKLTTRKFIVYKEKDMQVAHKVIHLTDPRVQIVEDKKKRKQFSIWVPVENGSAQSDKDHGLQAKRKDHQFRLPTMAERDTVVALLMKAKEMSLAPDVERSVLVHSGSEPRVERESKEQRGEWADRDRDRERDRQDNGGRDGPLHTVDGVHANSRSGHNTPGFVTPLNGPIGRLSRQGTPPKFALDGQHHGHDSHDDERGGNAGTVASSHSPLTSAHRSPSDLSNDEHGHVNTSHMTIRTSPATPHPVDSENFLARKSPSPSPSMRNGPSRRLPVRAQSDRHLPDVDDEADRWTREELERERDRERDRERERDDYDEVDEEERQVDLTNPEAYLQLVKRTNEHDRISTAISFMNELDTAQMYAPMRHKEIQNLFNKLAEDEKNDARPIEFVELKLDSAAGPAIPQTIEHGVYRLMAVLYESIQHGAHISDTLYMPREVWFQHGAKFTAYGVKVDGFTLLQSEMMNIGPSAIEHIQPFLDTLWKFRVVCEKVQNRMAQHLAYIHSVKHSVEDDPGMSSKNKGKFWDSLKKKVTRGVNKTTKNKVGDTTTYVQLLASVLQRSKMFENWVQTVDSVPGLESRWGFGRKREVEQHLQAISEFFHSCVCNVVIRDMKKVIKRYLKHCARSVADSDE